MLPEYIIDLHVHPSLKPRHFDPEKTIWENIPKSKYCDKKDLPLLARSAVKDIALSSQTNLEQCRDGKVKGLFLALYPPERPIFDLRNLLDWLSAERKEVNLGTCISGFERSFVEKFIDQVEENLPVDYMSELQSEYEYLVRQSERIDINGQFKIAGDYQEMKQFLAEPNTITGVITIEGLHSVTRFADYESINTPFELVDDANSAEYRYYLEIFGQGIDRIKHWGEGKHAPFFITFAHHFWNLLCGHAPSFSGAMRTFGVNQNFGICKPFTKLGYQVMDMMLDRSQGRRILIDTKHMSAEARIDFYRKWEEYERAGDPFPIIASHVAVSGVPKLSDRANRRDNNLELEGQYFNTWSINLTDEDIEYVFRSQGLIGIVLHEGRMPGGISKEIIEYYIKRKNQDGLRTEYIRLIMSNIFHIIRVCKKFDEPQKAWDLICLGSDLDGLINSFDVYTGANQMHRLATDMLQFLHRPIDNPHVDLKAHQFQELMYDYTPEQLVDKIMRQNIENFLEKFFNDDYLRGGSTVTPIA